MLTLRAAFSQNPRLVPLLEGAVQPEGIELSFELGGPGAMFHHHLKDDDFDVFEFSLSDYMVARDRAPRDRWDWTAIPIFLSRAFLLLNAQVCSDSDVAGPADLRGRRFGLPDFTMTAGLWLRAMIKELHGIGPDEIHWYNGRSAATSHGVLLGVNKDPLPGISLTWLERDGLLPGMLEGGELDAAYWDSPESGGRRQPGDSSKVRPLFEDGGRSFIEGFFRKTGFTPANHTVVVQRKLVEKEPWVAPALFEAFERSKQEAYRQARARQSAYLLFPGEDFDRQADVYGPDPYPSGLTANRRMLQMAAQQSFEEGLTRRPASVDDLFWETVR